jgi:hypothetical protein
LSTDRKNNLYPVLAHSDEFQEECGVRAFTKFGKFTHGIDSVYDLVELNTLKL